MIFDKNNQTIPNFKVGQIIIIIKIIIHLFKTLEETFKNK